MPRRLMFSESKWSTDACLLCRTRQAIELALPLPNVLKGSQAMSPIESISIPEASEAGPPLNCEERIRLAQLETLIEGSLEKFLLAGRALLEIKTRRLYRQEYSTFQDYCMKRWAISERRGLDLVRSTAVAENLLAVRRVRAATRPCHRIYLRT